MYKVIYTKQAQKDAKKLSGNQKLKDEALSLLAILQVNPFEKNPPYKELLGDMRGAYSRRINFQHRLVYQVLEDESLVKILRMWSHYE